MMAKSLRTFAFCGALLAATAFTQAALIAPGVTALALPEADPTGGTVIASQTQPFATAGYSGTLTSQVISGDPSNPLGGLTFTYAIQSNVVGTNAMTRLAVNGYTSFTTDMSYKPGTGTVAATINDRTATGDVVGFTYIAPPLGNGVIVPGALTNLMVVQTNAVAYRPTIAIVIDGAITQVDSYAPMVIPEPVSAGAMLLGTALLRRRR